MKEYIIFAGVNGSGKSTLYHTFLSEDTNQYKNIVRINSDEMLVSMNGDWKINSDVIAASRATVKALNLAFKNNQSICQESTLTGKTITILNQFQRQVGLKI